MMILKLELHEYISSVTLIYTQIYTQNLEPIERKI